MIVSRIMRHKSFETTKTYHSAGNVQKDAEKLKAAYPVTVSGDIKADSPPTNRRKPLP